MALYGDEWLLGCIHYVRQAPVVSHAVHMKADSNEPHFSSDTNNNKRFYAEVLEDLKPGCWRKGKRFDTTC